MIWSYIWIVLFFHSNQHTQFRKTVEINRNYCLILGFTIFIFIADQAWLLDNSQACTAVTFLSHYIWLSAFAWTSKTFWLPYTRHYKLRLVYFLPNFSLRFIIKSIELLTTYFHEKQISTLVFFQCWKVICCTKLWLLSLILVITKKCHYTFLVMEYHWL